MKKIAFVLALAIGLATVAPASDIGYVVILKNGSKIRAKEEMTIKGDQAIIVLMNGTMTAIPLAQVDLVATERYNQLGLGNAILLEGVGEETPVPTPTPTPPLGKTARLHKLRPVLGKQATPTPTPTPAIELRTVPYADKRVTTAFSNLLDKKHLYLYKTSAGTKPGYFFVQVVTDSQREVFHAIKTIAESFALIHELEPELAPKAVELQLVTSVNKSAGTFRMTPEQAEALASGKITPEQYYLKHVIF